MRLSIFGSLRFALAAAVVLTTTGCGEQTALLHSLKKQEDQLLFEVQPLKNQLQDLKNSLDQDRSIRQKLIHTKEDVLQILQHQYTVNEENARKDMEALERSTLSEIQNSRSRIQDTQLSWDKEPFRI